jgi:hypothetical protein
VDLWLIANGAFVFKMTEHEKALILGTTHRNVSSVPRHVCNRRNQILQSGFFYKLGEVCIVEAFFTKRHYDSFVVRDSASLRTAIAKVHPATAMMMKAQLHMTVRYPSCGVVPGVSSEHHWMFESIGPGVLLHIAQIYVASDVASAVVCGVDTPHMFTVPSESNRKPAHLTLWGHPPVRGGEVLVGKSLALRNPFMQMTEERLVAALAAHTERYAGLQSRLSEAQSNWFQLNTDNYHLAAKARNIEAENRKLEHHSEVIRGLFNSRVVRIQAQVRRFLATHYVRGIPIRGLVIVQALVRRKAAVLHIAPSSPAIGPDRCTALFACENGQAVEAAAPLALR